MAFAELPVGAVETGREYDECLRKLGFDAKYVFWAFDKVWGQFVLVLVSDFYEYRGPFKMHELLLKAYNSSLLPKEVDPFHVRLHSIDQPFARELASQTQRSTVVRNLSAENRPDTTKEATVITTVDDMIVSPNWIIRIRNERYREPVARRWNRFSSKVEELAAA